MANLASSATDVGPYLPKPALPGKPSAGKGVYFVLEGINSFATTLYFYYLFFFLPQQFGFTNKQNLICAAFSGIIYVFASWYSGRFAQRQGCHTALYFGFALMTAALLFGGMSGSALGHVLVLAGWTLGMSFTWPALEACVSESDTRQEVQRMVGLYNLVWSGTAALAYFVGGAMLEKLGPRSSFLVPAAMHLAQLIILFCATKVSARSNQFSVPHPSATHPLPAVEPPSFHPLSRAFLRMAWVANPFAYIAINSLIPTIPYLAKKFELSPMFAGFFCSIWLFSRMGAFLGLCLWPGWHYRFNYLMMAYLGMVISFITLLLAPNIWAMIFAQVIFGLAIGLIYYSSLYYSMDAGDTKGEHGGLHEAAIGVGNFAGPAIGATALHYIPALPNAGTWSVSGLLAAGLTALLVLSLRRNNSS